MMHFHAVDLYSAGTDFMLMQTGYIETSRQGNWLLAYDLTCLLLRVSFFIKMRQVLKVYESRQHKKLYFHILPINLRVNTVIYYL